MPKHDASPGLSDDSADEIDNTLATSAKPISKSSKSKTYSSVSKTKAHKRVEPESESEDEGEVTERMQSNDEEGSQGENDDEAEFEIESIEDVKIGAIPEVRRFQTRRYVTMKRVSYISSIYGVS